MPPRNPRRAGLAMWKSFTALLLVSWNRPFPTHRPALPITHDARPMTHDGPCSLPHPPPCFAQPRSVGSCQPGCDLPRISVSLDVEHLDNALLRVSTRSGNPDSDPNR